MKRKIAVLGLSIVLVGAMGANCIPPELFEQLNCPNPSAISLDVEVLTKSGSSGTIRLTGVVRNIGLQPFLSSTGQQSVQLYDSTSTLLAQVNFTNLTPGQAVTLTYETTWSSSNEFPPTYQLLISYDPDILLDANPDNDDCDATDNTVSLTGTQVNDAFAAF